MSKLALIFLLIFMNKCGIGAKCKDKSYFDFQERCFYYSSVTMEFANARQFCIEKGGDLSAFVSKETYIMDGKNPISHIDVWYPVLENEFSRDPNHSVFLLDGSESPLRWDDDQPSASYLAENCVTTIPYYGRLINQRCSTERHFFCEAIPLSYGRKKVYSESCYHEEDNVCYKLYTASRFTVNSSNPCPVDETMVKPSLESSLWNIIFQYVTRLKKRGVKVQLWIPKYRRVYETIDLCSIIDVISANVSPKAMDCSRTRLKLIYICGISKELLDTDQGILGHQYESSQATLALLWSFLALTATQIFLIAYYWILAAFDSKRISSLRKHM